ncbi:MAG: hypothetical protein ABJG88_04075 [Litorimonas sp.]
MNRFDVFVARFKALPRGGSDGYFQNRKYSITTKYGHNDRSAWLYAKELGGNNHISFNLYFLKYDKVHLKPCEMPASKVMDFVIGLESENAG